MKNEIKKIYNTLSGGKTISSDNYIISKSHFSSILKDRFVSELKKRGLIWDGNDIPFHELFSKKNSENIILDKYQTSEPTKPLFEFSVNEVGIDIQTINDLPDTIDYWEDEFYKSKFTSVEIAYCVSRNNPKESFAGLYSCKEALIKADNTLSWENINITHDENGKPFFQSYKLSISHSGLFAIAIAII